MGHTYISYVEVHRPKCTIIDALSSHVSSIFDSSSSSLVPIIFPFNFEIVGDCYYFEGISKLCNVLLVSHWIRKELFSVYIWSLFHDGLCGLETTGCSRAHTPIEAQ